MNFKTPKIIGSVFLWITGGTILLHFVMPLLGFDYPGSWIFFLFLLLGSAAQGFLSNRFNPDWFDNIVSWSAFLTLMMIGFFFFVQQL